MRVARLGARRRWLLLRLVAALCLFGLSARAEGLEYAAVDRATVRVLALGVVDTVEFERGDARFTLAAPMGGHGSGFVVHGDGLIVTAAHVVATARSVAVHAMGVVGPLAARVVHVDEVRDVALLRVSHQFADVAPLAEPGTQLKVREQVHAIGFPLDATRTDPQSSSGVVSGILPDGRLQLGMTLNPGNSGGPVISQSDAVFGLVSARVESSAGAQGLAVAVPLDAFRSDIQRELETPHAFSPGAAERKLADLVSLIAHEGERIVRGSLEPESGEAVRTERQVRQLIKQMPKSPDAALLGAAFFWNRHVADRVHQRDASGSRKNAVKLVRHAVDLDARLKSQSKFVRHVLAKKQGIERAQKPRVNAGGQPEGVQEPRVTFSSPDDEVTLHVKLGEGRGGAGGYTVLTKLYARVCQAPCEASLEEGNYAVALSKGGRAPLDLEETVYVSGPTSIEGRYKDRLGIRLAGYVILFGGGGVGTYYALKTEEVCEYNDTLGENTCSPEYRHFRTGLAIMSASMLTGLIMSFVPDSGELSVTPGVAGLPVSRRQVGMEDRLRDLQGLSIRARF